MKSDAVYNTIIQLQVTDGSNSKKSILVQLHEDLPQKILRYTLDPHKMYYMKKIPKPYLRGTHQIEELGFKLLDSMSNRSLSGRLAKDTVLKYMSSLTHKSQMLFEMILLKSFRAGIGAETVNAVFHGLIPVYKVMKCEDWDPKRFIPGSYVGTKLDGIRSTYRDGSFWTRSGHRIAGVEHIINYAKDIRLEQEWDGELDIPGREFNEASGVIRAKYSPHKERIRFTCFDIPLWDGPFHERQDYYYKKLYNNTLGAPIVPLGHSQVRTVGAVDEMFKYALSQGHEGVVVKTPDHSYQRRRSFDWMKLKCGEFMDCSVYDYREGEGKFAGMIGKLIVQDLNTKRFHVIGVGKMTQRDQRQYFSSGFSAIRGNMVEVAYMEKQPSGDLRHGRFNKFLWDR